MPTINSLIYRLLRIILKHSTEDNSFVEEMLYFTGEEVSAVPAGQMMEVLESLGVVNSKRALLRKV